jgi:glycosyltransferase involved in cell wall biosynthesis
MRGESMNLEEKGCGVICEPGMKGVKEGLEKILKMSDAKRDEMGKKGREWMREDFSWAAAAKKMVESYRKNGNLK